MSSIGACLLKVCHQQMRMPIPSKAANDTITASSNRPAKRSRDDLNHRETGSNNNNMEDAEEDEMNYEDKLFGKSISSNEDKESNSTVRLEVAVLQSCLEAIVNNLDLFWKRSEEYPVECLSEGTST
jgi:hypothetical protein